MVEVAKEEAAYVASPRDRWIAAVEIVAAILLMVGNLVGILPFSSTPFLLLLTWMSLRLRRVPWRDIGFTRPTHPLRTVVIGTITGVVFQFASLYALEPLLARMTGALPDASLFSSLRGNVSELLITLLIVWSLAAFGEEITFRGYLTTRVRDLFGPGRYTWALAVIVTSVLFGMTHLYQGGSGVLENIVAGLVFGALYLGAGRNLMATIIAHGVFDTVGAMLLFLGKYPV
jgi:membrane protease YdiL (CAAX protease family)